MSFSLAVCGVVLGVAVMVTSAASSKGDCSQGYLDLKTIEFDTRIQAMVEELTPRGSEWSDGPEGVERQRMVKLIASELATIAERCKVKQSWLV